jgi:hypothetical protein
MPKHNVPLRILITGDRDWIDAIPIIDMLKVAHPSTIIIHGAAKGADKLAGIIAEHYGLKVLPYPAEWTKYGKPAGPIRNKQMIDEGKPDYVLAFHNDIKNSKGTKNMIEQSLKAHIPVRLYSNGEWRRIYTERDLHR